MIKAGEHMIRLKRAYEPAWASDGTRFLADHSWPRVLRKEELKVKSWIKAVSPSNELRQWFGHDPENWKVFQRRYFAEMDKKPETWRPLLEAARQEDITLVFSPRDEKHNNAVALKNYLEKRLNANALPRLKRLASAPN